jgi:hypothetical protein
MSQTAERGVEKQEFELDLSKIGMLIIIPVAFWAYYTTFRGMVLLTRGETTSETEIIFGTIGALIGSAAILILMALTSWILGSDLAASFANQRRPDSSTRRNLALLICAFLFFFGLSVFFSYTYYHNNFFNLTSVRHVGVNHPGELNTKFIGQLRTNLNDNYKEGSATIRQTDSQWSSSVAELIRLAGDGRSEIESDINNQTKESAAKQAKIVNEAREAQLVLDKNRERRAEIQREIDRIGGSMQPDLDRIAAARKQEIDAEAEAEREVFGQGGSNAKKGRGQHYSAAKRKAEDARAIQKARNAVLAPRREEVKKLEREAKPLDDAVPGLQNKIKAAENIGPSVVLSESASGYDLVLDRLRQSYDAPSRAIIDDARPHCERLVTIIRATKFADRIPKNFNCLPSVQAANTLLDARARESTARIAFDKQCSEAELRKVMTDISRQVETKQIEPADSLPRARKVVETCISLAVPVGLTSTQEIELLRDIADFARQNQTDINVFDRAMNSLHRLDGDARMAMAVALAQDLLILVFRFVAENYRYRSRRRQEAVLGRPLDLADRDTDDPEIRAWKALLRLSRPGDGETSRLADMDIAAQGFEPDVLANIYGTLNNLGRQGAAWRDRKDNFIIENSAMRAIERELQMLQGQMSPSDGDHPPDAAEWPHEERDSSYPQAPAGHRRAAGGPGPSSSASSSAVDQPAAPRSTRRGRLREFLTGSLEPRSERTSRSRREPLIRFRDVKRVEKPAYNEPVDVPHRDEVAAETLPARTRSENPFDYISRFTSSKPRNSD